jgi:predicted transposase/invertase (TIGR01784 family)
MRATFADPKTDLVFKRIFGSETHKHLLVELLNALLELEKDRRIDDVTFLPPEQTPPLHDLKLSIVDVKCIDRQKTEYVVEMQVFNTRSFEERVVYNACKSFVHQLPSPERYSDLGQVVGVTICNFKLWPGPGEESGKEPAVPMLSRWRMQEQHTGIEGLPQVQYAFLELPKYTGGPHPESMIDKWACFFRQAGSLAVIPPELDLEPFREAFEVARIAGFNQAELVAYDREKMAEGDARGRVELAEQRGVVLGLRRSIVRLWERGFGPMPEEARRRLEAVGDVERLDHVLEQVSGADSVDEVDL